MKKILAALCLMMSLPTLTLAAGQNMISVSELHRQAEEMGRWQKTYATPNGELNVDIPILVPDVEKCPVITVENDRPFTQETADEMLKTAFKRDGITMFCYEMDGLTVDVDWATLGMGTTEDYESAKEFGMNAGEWRYGEWPNYGSTPIDYRYPWELDMDSSYIRGGDQTVAQAMAAFQHVIDEAYPNKGYTIAPKRIAIHGSTTLDEPGDGRNGYYDIRAEQLMNGIPMIGAISSFDGDNNLLLHSGNEPNRGSSRPLQRWFDVEHECLFDDVRHKRHRLLCECQHEPHPHRGAGGCAARAA